MTARDPLRNRVPTVWADRLRSLAPATAAAMRQVFQRPPRVEGARGVRLGCQAREPVQATEAVEIQIEDQTAWLGVHHAGCVPNTEPHWSDLLGRARLLAWSLAHEAMLMRLQDALGACVLPVRMGPAPVAQEQPYVWMDWQLDAGDPSESASGWMALPPALVERIAARVDETPAARPGPLSVLPVHVGLALPAVRMSARLGRSLMPGSVIVLGVRAAVLDALAAACRGADGRRVWLRPVELAEKRLMLGEGPEPAVITLEDPNGKEDSMEDAQYEGNARADEAGRPTAPPRLAVELAFELGRQTLPLAQADALQPGYVFELPVPADGARVRILSHGQVIGHGEVVVVGEVLGVRVVQWGGDGL